MLTKPLLVKNRRCRGPFRRIVEKLWRKRAARLLEFINPSRGRSPKLRREWRNRQLGKLQDLIEKDRLPALRIWVSKSAKREQVRLRRWTPRYEKAVAVKDVLTARGLARHRHLAYVAFDGRNNCLKVGRSDNGLGRIVGQRKHDYFARASRVAVYFPNKRKKKILPRLECALTHLFKPPLDAWPPLTKYRERCPVCGDWWLVQDLVEKIFPA